MTTRHLKRTEIGNHIVSTIDVTLVGIAVDFVGYRYETMIFMKEGVGEGEIPEFQERTFEEGEALKNHEKAIELCTKQETTP